MQCVAYTFIVQSRNSHHRPKKELFKALQRTIYVRTYIFLVAHSRFSNQILKDI